MATQPSASGLWTEPSSIPHPDTHQLLYLTLALAVAVISCIRVLTTDHDKISFLNPSKRPGILGRDPSLSGEFTTNARGLLDQGREAFPGQPFKMMTEAGEMTILPPALINEIRNKSDLSFMGALADDFHAHIDGFQPFGVGVRPDSLLQVVVRKQLTKLLNKVTKPLSEETSFAMDKCFGQSSEWKEHVLKTEILDIIARISSRVFLGPEIARNDAWLHITKSYTVNVVAAAEKLRKYAPCWRRLASLFLPECQLLRQQVAELRVIIDPVIQQRKRDRQAAAAEGRPPPAYNDALDWFEEESHGKPYDAAMFQLILSVAAIHTTTDLLTEVMLNLVQHPALFDDLRREIAEVLKAEGWKKTALYNLKLLDSVIKESQRLRPVGMVLMNRLALRDVTLSSGMTIRKGQRTAFDTARMRDPSVYSDPDTFDARRFARMRDTPGLENQAHFVSTGEASFGFGHGVHACPGRFFAANEIKVALCHLLIKYDWELARGCVPKMMENGFSIGSDPVATVMVRRRDPELDIDAL